MALARIVHKRLHVLTDAYSNRNFTFQILAKFPPLAISSLGNYARLQEEEKA